MREQDYAVHHGQQVEQQEISKVLRNTYSLLALTLAFSGVMAFVAQQMRVGYPNVFVVLIGFYGLFFLTNKLRDSAWGLVSTFALTGFMGFILGPILNRYLGMAGGAEVVSSAFAMTALVFGGLSAYVLITRKDMSFLSGFITAGFFVLLGAVVASFFFHAYWNLPADKQMMQQLMFFKNVGVTGGLLALAAFGAGAWSLDARRSDR